MTAKKNPSDDVTVTHKDFLRLAHVTDPNNWEPGLRIDDSGIWVDDSVGEQRTMGEAAVLEAHPDGNIRKPVIAFPSTLGELRTRLLPTIGEGWLDPFELADFVATQRPLVASKWPWGKHETKLLQDLEAAGKRYIGENYDPENTDTATKSNVIQAWLKSERHTPERDAEVIAKMVRGAGR